MEKRPRSFPRPLAVVALGLAIVGVLAITSDAGGAGGATREGASTAAARPATHRAERPARPVVEADVSGALEAEGVGAAMAECAGRRVGAVASPSQLSRARRQPAYAWRWAWKAAGACRRTFMAANGPFA